MTAGTQIKLAEVQLIFDGQVRAKGDAAVEVDGRATVVQGEASNKVQGEASNKATGKPGSEVSSKSGGKVQGEASNKATGRRAARSRASPGARSQGEASNKATGKTGSEVSSKSGGKVQGEASNKATGKTAQRGLEPSPAGKVPPNEPTQTFVRRQISRRGRARPGRGAVPYLTAVAGITEGDTTFRLEQRDHVYMFGRTRRCEFRVNDAEVSREHASFTRRERRHLRQRSRDRSTACS